MLPWICLAAYITIAVFLFWPARCLMAEWLDTDNDPADRFAATAFGAILAGSWIVGLAVFTALTLSKWLWTGTWIRINLHDRHRT